MCKAYHALLCSASIAIGIVHSMVDINLYSLLLVIYMIIIQVPHAVIFLAILAINNLFFLLHVYWLMKPDLV